MTVKDRILTLLATRPDGVGGTVGVAGASDTVRDRVAR